MIRENLKWATRQTLLAPHKLEGLNRKLSHIPIYRQELGTKLRMIRDAEPPRLEETPEMKPSLA